MPVVFKCVMAYNVKRFGLLINMRIRLIYEKMGNLRYTSALDIQKIWERSFKRAQIPLTYSQGFHPHPKMQIGLPLPLGYLGCEEIIDIWIENEMNLDSIQEKLTVFVPGGINLKNIQKIDESEKPLPNRIESADYEVRILNGHPEMESLHIKIQEFMGKHSIIRKRREKEYDLRPLVKFLGVSQGDKRALCMQLRAEPGKTGRPDEVLDELGLDLSDCLIIRKKIHIQG